MRQRGCTGGNDTLKIESLEAKQGSVGWRPPPGGAMAATNWRTACLWRESSAEEGPCSAPLSKRSARRAMGCRVSSLSIAAVPLRPMSATSTARSRAASSSSSPSSVLRRGRCRRLVLWSDRHGSAGRICVWGEIRRIGAEHSATGEGSRRGMVKAADLEEH